MGRLCLGFARIAAILFLSAALPQLASAQQSGPNASPPCTAKNIDPASLDIRKGAIEKSLADARRARTSLSETKKQQTIEAFEASDTKLRKEIETLEGELVDIIYLLDCQQTAAGKIPTVVALGKKDGEETGKGSLNIRSGGGLSGFGGSGGGGNNAMRGRTRGMLPGAESRQSGADNAPAPPSSGGLPNIAASDPKPASEPYVEVTTYYATNRKTTGNIQPAEFYGTDDADSLQYGRFVVTVPSSHKVGEIEMPSLWKLEFSSDPSKHFTIKELTPLETAAAHEQIKQAARTANSRSLLVFVHGFNVTFAEAGLRTAQLAHDLAFPGVAMFMSWPSSRLYTHSVESVEVAKDSLNKFFDDIATMPFDDIYIVAHSMGTRLVSNVLAARQQRGVDLSKIREILLGAPDINAQLFRTQIAPALAKLTRATKTIYASSNDLALKASKAVQGYPRVGDTSEGVFTYPGFDTIDCSNAAPRQREWGHSYLFDSNVVIADLIDALIGKKDIAKRKVKRAGVAPELYWMLD
jgi:esterase/lipase superfamily enzyme